MVGLSIRWRTASMPRQFCLRYVGRMAAFPAARLFTAPHREGPQRGKTGSTQPRQWASAQRR